MPGREMERFFSLPLFLLPLGKRKAKEPFGATCHSQQEPCLEPSLSSVYPIHGWGRGTQRPSLTFKMTFYRLRGNSSEASQGCGQKSGWVLTLSLSSTTHTSLDSFFPHPVPVPGADSLGLQEKPSLD